MELWSMVATVIGGLVLGALGAYLWSTLARMRDLERRLAARAPIQEAVASIEPAERRSLPVLQPAPSKACEDCGAFDLDEGQAAIAAHRAFLGAAQHLTPAEMAAGPNQEHAHGVPLKASWDEFGACLVRRELVWGKQTPRARLDHFPALEGAPGDCWRKDFDREAVLMGTGAEA